MRNFMIRSSLPLEMIFAKPTQFSTNIKGTDIGKITRETEKDSNDA